MVQLNGIQVAENPSRLCAVSATAGSPRASNSRQVGSTARCLWSGAQAQGQKARVHNSDSSLNSSVTSDNFINISVLGASSITRSSPPLDSCED